MVLVAGLVVGCKTAPKPGTFASRQGDEIVVAGQFVHTGARVVTWMDPGGYDAYRVERRFSAMDKADWKTSQEEVKDLDMPNRYNLRRHGLSDEEIERVRGGGWDLPLLQRVVDQFVIHYDVCGTSRQCFKILHDMRDLSVHFMLDLDGTIYQTLDVKERAWHAGSANSRSVGIEIANMGAYPINGQNPFEQWYAKAENGQTRITIPQQFGDGGIRTKDFVGYSARPEPVTGMVQHRELIQYDYTPEQYEALIKLTAALCKALPNIKCEYPRDAEGKLILQKLPEAELDAYQGILGHYHIQTNKVDPGPAFQWDYVIGNARRIVHRGLSGGAYETSKGHLRPRF
ncbi:MAG TPA: peptidoglycan recognition family protein [Candidatus Paceibacterota bacterium]|nr:peptidoglycan recognition family protein [Verrucomicrobiota bacterium]HSA11803.1 peptidoglycan recognition family protein [Candidatus Paceibacterota bacterium]